MRNVANECSSSFLEGACGVVRYLVLAALWLSGCGLQVTSGAHLRNPHGAVAESTSVAGRWVQTRSDGVYAGSDLVFRGPVDAPVSLRQILAGAGYRWLGRPFSLELGAELGVGQPVYVHRQEAGFGGATGFYVGAASALLLRLYGRQDSEIGYAPAGVLVDIVLLARGGAWAAPQTQVPEVAEAGVQLGFRLTAVSDIVVTTNKNWSPP